MDDELIRINVGRSNAYLVRSGSRVMLVDTGPASSRDALMRALDGLDRIDLVVVTHVHEDHVGNLAHVAQRFGAKVVVHHDDAHYLRQGFAPLPRGTRLITRILSRIGNALMKGRGQFDPVDPSIVVNASYDLLLYGVRGALFHAPGHTDGSMIVVLEGEDCIVGDTLFNMRIFSPYPPFANDERVLRESIRSLVTCGCTTFHPGHGPPLGIDDIRSLISSRIFAG